MPPPTITNAILADRLDSLRGDICDAVDGMKDVTKGFNSFQLEYERRHAQLVTDVNVTKLDIQTQKTELTSLRDIVTRQAKEIGDLRDTVRDLKVAIDNTSQTVNRIMNWMSRIFWAFLVPVVLALSAFIWGLLTHNIIISIPK